MIVIWIIHESWHYDRYMNLSRALTATDFGESVRRVRKTRGFRQDELAERTGVTRMTISRLERGDPVSIETAIRALSECGFEVVVVPKFSRVSTIDQD